MSSTYLYTFIIPHHNCPTLLNRCLDSIPQREDIQIIVVDDNSDEDKRPCIKRNDVEVIYIDAEHTKGAGRARNYGLKAAKGKWLLFADCDDYYAEGFLDMLDKHKDEDIEVLYFNYSFIDGIDMSILPDRNLQKCILSFDGTEEMTDYIKYRNNTPWTKMVRLDFLKLNHIEYEEVINGNDLLFSLLIGYKADRIIVVKERLYNYVKTSGSIGTRKQSVSDIMCRITHIVKNNYFNEYIGHKEWNTNIVRAIAYYIKISDNSIRFRFLYSLLKNVSNMVHNRREWIDIINTLTSRLHH